MKCEFTVASDGIIFRTQTNGDHIEIKGIHLGPKEAANLAEMINTPDGNMTVVIKRGE